MTILTKESILSADDLPKELVEVPEWGGSVYVRAISGKEKSDFTSSLFETADDGSTKRKDDYMTTLSIGMLVRAICDEEGQRLFTDAEMTVLQNKSAAALTRLEEVCNRLNGIDVAAVEEAAKN